MESRAFGRLVVSALVCAGLALVGESLVAAPPSGSSSAIYPATAHPHGHSYTDWSVKYWQWALNQPVAGHPFVDSPAWDIASGQSGPVWYLASVIDTNAAVTTVVRTGSVPVGTSVFAALICSEWSDLEGYLTEVEQRDFANYVGDHIINSSCTVDGVPAGDLSRYRFETPQFSFDAPTPWVFGATGGTGNAVADGYYVMLKPMSVGQHTVHLGGTYHFSTAEGDPFDLESAIDTTYVLNVTCH